MCVCEGEPTRRPKHILCFDEPYDGFEATRPVHRSSTVHGLHERKPISQISIFESD